MGWAATMPTWRKPVGVLLIVLCVVNLVIGAVTWIAFEGSALNGKVERGRYYVGSRGAMTEVSEGAYLFSYWQGVSEMITLPLGLVGVLLRRFGSRRYPTAAESGAAPDTGRL